MHDKWIYKLTVLTEPVQDRSWGYPIAKARKTILSFKNFVLRDIMRRPNYGPSAVARNLVKGLEKIGANFNYNPAGLKDVGETVVVLSDLYALSQAIQWKREGRIKRLLAGPNLVILPSDCKELITVKEIDIYLVNSNWTYQMYITDAPELLGRCVAWPTGVDIDFWTPKTNHLNSKQILIFQKNGPSDLTDSCKKLIKSLGYNVIEIVYGKYKPSEYLQKLHTAEMEVFFSKSESQGIALLEAWAANVPTLVWNRGYMTYKGRDWTASSAPYLSDETGLFFRDFETFESAFIRWEKTKDNFNARKWVLENMSDEISAKKLYELGRI